MALISLHRHELAVIFGILGNIVSFGVYLAPVPTFLRIHRKKSTEGFQAIPYAVALFSAMLLLYYAVVKETDSTMLITINTIGCVIEGFYLTVYMIYAPRKARVYTAKVLGLFNVAFYALILLTTMVFARGHEHHTLFSRGGPREMVVGWICAVFSVCVFAAPLSVMRMVIRTKSVEFMPFCLSFALTLCAVMWFFYGFLIKDFYVAMPNVLGFAFGIAQMILYIIYKDSKKKNVLVGDQIKDGDIKQLQELAVDIKLGNIEKIDAVDSTGFETTATTRPQVIEIVLDDEFVAAVPHNEEGSVINGRVTDKEEIKKEKEKEKKKEKVAVGEEPRGESCV